MTDSTKENTAMGHARRGIIVIVALLALLAVAPQLAAAKHEVPKQKVPFHAQLVVLNEPPVLCAPVQLCLALSGNGQATHLGRVSEVGQAVIYLASQPGPTPDCRSVTNAMLLTGAKGDQLAVLLSGVNCQTGATSGITALTHGTWVVTGGSGRFNGATGSGTYTTQINSPEATAWAVLHGTLSIIHTR
jgi:hypothetical protein